MKVDEITSFQEDDDEAEDKNNSDEDDDEKSSEEESEGSIYKNRAKFYTGAVKIQTRNEEEDKDKVCFGYYPTHCQDLCIALL